MNGKKLYREFAISKGRDCHSFIEIEQNYDQEVLHYLDSKGHKQTMDFVHRDMVNWIIKVGSNKVFDHMLLSNTAN